MKKATLSVAASSVANKKTCTHSMEQIYQLLHQRVQLILNVLDDALASDNMKDRTWAVEQCFKVIFSAKRRDALEPDGFSGEKPAQDPSLNLAELSDEALTALIKQELGE